jgi:hypothetical protein
MNNFYRKKEGNVDLFDSYALQLVSGMLLYERIKLQQKKLYLEAIKNLIFQYEHQYNDDSHDRLLEKLKETTIDSFSTVEHFFKIEFGENKQDEVKFEYNYEALERMFNDSTTEKKLEYVRGWLKRPPRALPPCFLAWVKSLPENEKETLRKLRAETVRRHKEGLIPADNNGKSIDEVFGSENEERKMQSVENWIKYCKRPLPKCFQAYIENLHEDEKERLRELYREFHEKKENIHLSIGKVDYETGEIL